jgi:S-adenosylmethionine hydrolase
LNELQTVKVNSEEINFDSFEQQPTIQNFSEFIFSILEKENIPKDAKIINYDEFSIVVSYTRKETMEEITFRLYSSIEYEIKKNEYEMNKQLEIMKTHQEKLDQIKEKIRNQKNKYEEIKSNA